MEIGSFIPLDIRRGSEYHEIGNDTLRLNTARAGIFHATKLYGCNTIYLPYYQCPTVCKFLNRKGVNIEYYHINDSFEPIEVTQKEGSVFLIVNYFGVLSEEKIKNISSSYLNVIIDNSAAFYMSPLNGCMNVYSTRKFFGVADGCYIIGENASKLSAEYSTDFSSDTAAFLLKRIEYSTEEVYAERMKNEDRIDVSDIKLMSILTKSLLCGIDYSGIASKRKVNFDYAHSIFRDINLINPTISLSTENVAMVYPLVIEDKDLMEKLREKKIFTGRWWTSVLLNVPEDSFEAFLSKFMLPIPIDQRYNKMDILYVSRVLFECINS